MDSKDFDLSEKVLEELAEQVHIAWMENRIKEGWTYGKERNEIKKTTPCIVPYNELPETEKEYDRNTVRTTLKALSALGYKISKDNKDNKTKDEIK